MYIEFSVDDLAFVLAGLTLYIKGLSASSDIPRPQAEEGLKNAVILFTKLLKVYEGMTIEDAHTG